MEHFLSGWLHSWQLLLVPVLQIQFWKISYVELIGNCIVVFFIVLDVRNWGLVETSDFVYIRRTMSLSCNILPIIATPVFKRKCWQTFYSKRSTYLWRIWTLTFASEAFFFFFGFQNEIGGWIYLFTAFEFILFAEDNKDYNQQVNEQRVWSHKTLFFGLWTEFFSLTPFDCRVCARNSVIQKKECQTWQCHRLEVFNKEKKNCLEMALKLMQEQWQTKSLRELLGQPKKNI